MHDQKRRSYSFISLVLLLVVSGIFVFAFLNRQYLIDSVVASQYKPSAAISSIRDKLGLTNEGKRLFDASQPMIDDASTFNESCNQKSETNNPILGCYARQRIYIYNVSNTELDGIEETTAAHELLHAVYERMSDSEKSVVDAALTQAYESLKTPELEARMEYYKSAEPGQELNELHSILGTEQMTLPSVLEEHYQKYFTSRQKIAGFFTQYNSVFTATTNRLKELEQQINSSVTSVNQRIAQYNTATAALQTDTTAFNAKSSDGGFTSQAEFASQRTKLVERQQALSEERRAIEAQISDSQKLREEYNKLVEKYNQLSRSINSSLAPAPSL